MAITAAINWQGAQLFIGTGAKTASRITSGGTKQAGFLGPSGSPGRTAEVAKSAPLDQVLVNKGKGAQDPGSITLMFEKNDTAQSAIIAAAAHATNQYPFLITLPGTSQNINFTGYVVGDTNPGGSGTDFIKRQVVVELVLPPV